MKKILTAVFIAVAGFIAATSLIYAKTYPAPTGYINDFASVISSDVKQSLETNLTQFESDTEYELTVVTLTSLEGDVIENVAIDIFEQWGIGKKDKDNGVLLLIAVDDRAIRIETGYGAEPVLTDSRAGNIIRTVIAPEFKQANYDAGISRGVEAIKQILTQDPTLFDSQTTTGTATANDRIGAFIFAAIILIYLSAFLARSKRFWPGGVIGVILGFIFAAITGAVLLGFFGLLLDYLLSKNYKKRKTRGLPTSFFTSMGGFSSGSSRGGFSSGFGGFGGGRSGGGGASGGW